MNAYLLSCGLAATAGFMFLRPRTQVAISMFVMTSCFDLAPRIVAGIDVWDIGIVLMLLSWIPMKLFYRATWHVQWNAYLTLLGVFVLWMYVSLAWSLFIFGYSPIDTLKVSRQLCLGYLSVFVLLRLFAIDAGAMAYLLRASYLTTYVGMGLCIIQYIIQKPLFFGLITDYGGTLRALPVFVPLCALHLWDIAGRIMSGHHTRVHERLYAALVLSVIALSFTRGYYIATTIALLTLTMVLIVERRMSLVASTSHALMLACGVAVLLGLGTLDRVVARFGSGLDLVTGDRRGAQTENDIDTMTGRLLLAKERFELVIKHNPFIGFGFLHEEHVPGQLRNKLRYGSVINTPEFRERYRYGARYALALASADIGWAEIIIRTGVVGLVLFVGMLLLFVTNYVRDGPRVESMYHLRLAFAIQILFSVITMFISTPFVSLVHIVGFMLAGYTYSTGRSQPVGAAMARIRLGI